MIKMYTGDVIIIQALCSRYGKIILITVQAVSVYASRTGGNAGETPETIALADPDMAEIATQAAPFIAASVITTAVCTPILTSWINKKNKETKTPELEEIQI